jgi:hypothetical protein
MKRMRRMTMTMMMRTPSNRETRACWISRRRRAEVKKKKSRMRSDDHQ